MALRDAVKSPAGARLFASELYAWLYGHVPHRHGHDSHVLSKVAFWLVVIAWVLAALLAPRPAGGATVPVISATEAPRLVWPSHESWRPHFYE